MKNLFFFAACCTFLCLLSCGGDQQSTKDDLVGTWVDTITMIISYPAVGGNPPVNVIVKNETYEFDEAGTYHFYSTPDSKGYGTWSVDEGAQTIALEHTSVTKITIPDLQLSFIDTFKHPTIIWDIKKLDAQQLDITIFTFKDTLPDGRVIQQFYDKTFLRQ